MSLKYRDIGDITWQHANIRCVDLISSESMDFAFDKGTLNAMIHGSPWDPPDEIIESTGRHI